MSSQPPVLPAGALRPRAIRALLEPDPPELAPSGRRILAVDDLDRWSPSLLHLLSDAVDARRAALVATVRSSALEQLLSRFRPAEAPVLVELPPWRAADLSHHTRAVLDGPLHPVDGAALVQFSSGNPLCLVEMIEHGRLTGRLQRRHAVWSWALPLTVPPITAARVWSILADEPSAVLEVLTTLAIAEPLSLPVLVRVHSLAAVTDAEDRGWLMSTSTRNGVLVHLTRHLDGQVAAASVSQLRQRALRAALVEALAVERHGDGDAMVAAVAACVQTGVGLPESVRIPAAATALRRHRTALAVELTDEMPDAAAVQVRAAALAEQGRFRDAAITLGAPMPAGGAEPAASPVPSARPPWSAALRALAGEPDDSDTVGSDPVAMLCADSWSGRRLEAAAAVGGRSLASTPLPEQSRSLRLAATSWAHLQLGQVEQALDLAGTAPAGPPGVVRTTSECLLVFTVGLANLVRGSVREAGSHGERLCRVGIDEQWHLAYCLGAFLRGRAAAAEARPELARRRLSESAASLAQAAPLVDRRGILQALALAHRMSGREPGADSAAPGDARTTPAPLLLTELGHLAEAEALLLGGRRRAAAELAGLVADRARTGGWPLVLLQALHLVARTNPSAAVADELAQVADTADFDLAVRYGAHAVAAVSGDRPGLTDAAEHFEGLGLRWLAAETAAAALAGADRSHLGVEWAARATRVLGRLDQEDDVALPESWGAASARVARVTPRELEIAEAVVRGETSAQIAQRLSLSRRTVENHLQHIYRKLGIARREDLDLAYGTVVPRAPGHSRG
ncbi:helix-turn-helix transcriptional regulator [Cellulomonas fengjieae]|uniref:helix-turn-helix transcriptional regulator n=1 Tax=Cellulomonas fengjieae TaxID=2819978 RepID=UPI001AAF3E09|nr:helix-turn-helix transcriptional regulator [Cellulomonas fengjieae]MBO3102778.1 helix-turn-helix transcriptional regulator [Cellulomonas fengjieae]